MVTKQDVIKVLRKVNDPEVSVNIVDLGFIYDVKISKTSVHIKMTLTNPLCPMHSFITKQVEQEVKKIKGIEKVEVELVFDPPWTPDKIDKKVREKLGI